MPDRTPADAYIDGFNLSYGARDSCDPLGLRHKWLNILRLLQLVAPEYEIKRLRYFTANLKPHDSTKAKTQRAYLRALRTLPDLEMHKGEYRQDTVSLPRADGGGMVDVLKNEEKGSDVNLATYLLLDALVNPEEPRRVALVVTNDSDLRRPIQIVRDAGVEVGVLNPHVTYPLGVLRTVASWVRPIRPNVYDVSQFPREVATKPGESVIRPSGW
jgi:hypothetical protein